MTLKERQDAMKKRRARKGRPLKQQQQAELDQIRTRKRVVAFLLYTKGWSVSRIALQLKVRPALMKKAHR